MRQRALPDIWRKRAVNWLSLVVLGVVMATFGTYLSDRLADSEAIAMRVVLNNLRSQLVIEESTARVKLEKASLAKLDGSNPMALVGGETPVDAGRVNWEPETPESYIGGCDRRQPGEIGVWCFDPTHGELRYYPRFGLGDRFERAFNGEAYTWRVAVTERGHLSLVPVGVRGETL